jgi:hypothetical protein
MKISTVSDLLVGALCEEDRRVFEQLFDQMPNTAFFIKNPPGRCLAVNDSLVERHGLRKKSQLVGQRPCDVCQEDFGRIPAEQDA